MGDQLHADSPISPATAVLRSLHFERMARAAAVPQVQQDTAKRSQALQSGKLGVRRWTAAQVCGCTHGVGACINCCGWEDVSAPWSVCMVLDTVFALCGPMPRPSHSELESTDCRRALVAGEITWPGWLGMLQWAGAAQGEAFLDCGAGHGRAVAVYAALFGPAHGIEIRPSIAETAIRAVTEVHSRLVAQPANPQHDGGLSPAARGSIECGDMFADGCSWDAPLILINATGFGEALMKRCITKIEQSILGLKDSQANHRRVLVLSQPLGCKGLKLHGSRVFSMSWGQCTVYLYHLCSANYR